MWRNKVVRLALARLQDSALPIGVRFWNGEEYMPPGEILVRLTVHDVAALRALVRPTLGRLARAYVEGHIDLDGDMRDILMIGEKLCAAASASDEKRVPAFAWLRQTRPAARKNISYHYDISNDFYALWLDANHVYSCAYFRKPEDTLDRAQEQKLDHICRKLMLREGETLLDIGCGWGGLILWAAKHYGARCVGITLSQSQHDYVVAEIARRGLTGRVEVRLQDYRDVPEDAPFDKITSVGMFEHVGCKHLVVYFSKMQHLLKPGGLAMNHGITYGTLDAKGLRSDIADFAERYVFPGGELTHVSAVIAELSRAGLECLDVESLRPHYARTLWHWVDRLEAHADEARRIAGDKAYRIWRIYMAGSAHVFSRGWMSLFQVLVGKPLPDGSLPYPYTRDHVYRGLEEAPARPWELIAPVV